MNEIRFTTKIGEDQVIRPPQDVKLPKGKAEVVVTHAVSRTEFKGENLPRPTWPLVQRLAELASKLGVDLSADLAQNHDHYAHGAPKGVDEQ